MPISSFASNYFGLAELNKTMKMVASNLTTGEDNADTFAQRAEAYYRKRPHLLHLLQQLYDGYLSLAHRYCQTLANHHHHRQHSSPLIPALRFDSDEDDGCDIVSNAESSLSYQLPLFFAQAKTDADTIVAELVMKAVEYEIVVHELSTAERRWSESTRKVELQKSLLEVVEAERVMVLNDTARLVKRAAALAEENRGLAAESVLIKRKTGELARCVLRKKEDHKVLMLRRRIENLQGQICGLEKRNKEYYLRLVKLGGEVTLENCFQVDEEAVVTTSSGVADVIMNGGGRAHNGGGSGSGGGGRRIFKLWDRIKNFDMFMCGA